ncbi:MAG TPA: ArdC-like ssDNA-binding domain-containing protein [Fimbriiglobus sp.]
MRATREQIQQEALSRAAGGHSFGNWPAILAGFVAKGIPADDIRPRENVFTYHAWRALGRQVRRGEHGVKVVTFVDVRSKSPAPVETPTDGTGPTRRTSGRRPWTATVFHLTQTDPVSD